MPAGHRRRGQSRAGAAAADDRGSDADQVPGAAGSHSLVAGVGSDGVVPGGYRHRSHAGKSLDAGQVRVQDRAIHGGRSAGHRQPGGGQCEIVSHGDTGLLAEEIDDWTEAIRRLASDPSLRAGMGRNGRKRVEEEYSLDRAADLWMQVLNQAVASA